jgi:stage V sporulation protein G
VAARGGPHSVDRADGRIEVRRSDDGEDAKEMDITEVKVFPIQEEKLKAFVSIVFDHCFMVNDIKIIQGKDGLFISMPSRKKKNGEFKDVAHPLNNETRRMIEGKILAEYERVLGERGEDVPAFGERYADPGALGLAAVAPPEQTMAAAASEKTMEEIEEIHLRDSFWTVT